MMPAVAVPVMMHVRRMVVVVLRHTVMVVPMEVCESSTIRISRWRCGHYRGGSLRNTLKGSEILKCFLNWMLSI